ncbi:MAG: SRPBCC family protein [Acidobacteria bacterium]|jgi:uncharacterized membrane protein|nr:SRPBCC family protein [Acidobacteriota bacterium]
MGEIKRSVTIAAPLAEVFRFASDYQKWPEFFVGVSNVRPVTETTRGNRARFIYRVQALGMKFTVGTELREFRENEGWLGRSFKGLEHQTQWMFRKSNGGTAFTFIQRQRLPLYLGGKLVERMFIQPEWIKIIESSLLNLKRIMEKKRIHEG